MVVSDTHQHLLHCPPRTAIMIARFVHLFLRDTFENSARYDAVDRAIRESGIVPTSNADCIGLHREMLAERVTMLADHLCDGILADPELQACVGRIVTATLDRHCDYARTSHATKAELIEFAQCHANAMPESYDRCAALRAHVAECVTCTERLTASSRRGVNVF
jgi:hypothetical protein